MTITNFRYFSLILGILGFLFFGSLFGLSYINPLFIEQTTKTIISHRLETAVGEKIDSLNDHALVNKAQQLLKKNDVEANKLKQQSENFTKMQQSDFIKITAGKNLEKC